MKEKSYLVGQMGVQKRFIVWGFRVIGFYNFMELYVEYGINVLGRKMIQMFVYVLLIVSYR